MARPINADAMETQKRILDAASFNFAQYGYGGASMRTIARQASVSQGSIHHYFSTKSALYQACIDDIYRQIGMMESQFLGVFSQAKPEKRLIFQLILQSYQFARSRRDTVKMIYRSVIHQGENQYPQRSVVLQRILEQLIKWLEPYSCKERLEVKFALYGFIFLLNRIVLVEREELISILEITDPDVSDDEVEQQVGEYLGRSFLGLVGL